MVCMFDRVIGSKGDGLSARPLLLDCPRGRAGPMSGREREASELNRPAEERGQAERSGEVYEQVLAFEADRKV
jgi:hypothetical protein